MTLESVSVCPICDNSSFHTLLTARDYTVSQEDFNLQQCTICNFVITNPRPDNNSIAEYYKSENYISHSGTRKTLLDKIYIQARNVTLKWKYELISQYQKPGNILDYGCGTGEFLHYMQSKKWNITGVEPSALAREKASVLTSTKILEEPTTGNSFNAITLWHVLEHVHNLNEKIEELISLLSKDGIIFIAVPNRESKDAIKYKSYWAGYDVPRHLWHFSPDNMQKLLARHKLTLMKAEPMKLDSYYVSMLSETYKHPNLLSLITMTKALFSGLQSNLNAINTGSYSSLIYIAKRS